METTTASFPLIWAVHVVYTRIGEEKLDFEYMWIQTVVLECEHRCLDADWVVVQPFILTRLLDGFRTEVQLQSLAYSCKEVVNVAYPTSTEGSRDLEEVQKLGLRNAFLGATR
ncbi:hypothetical protein P153DRAFT_382122 [Dothidotthia symphoricarpi CBS 119687]|uniref:Uncharacterized protein n=1 Tax=Dothidotthia symphoricarpi CBS 119687 TaxID=1392245 RepID=A0A6A6AKM2_9PLEO|nr:uncharacterized protein P153DRAFT_382122 [Dothidotthia symphoricarpi CBS 119687]KAF2132499.1 hypothetical protein P153DRAFT_382122 [Dothidotthia symphoricarpi CBS 119687]